MSSERTIALSSKLSFGVGQAAEGLKNTAFALFVLFYYNQVLGVPGTLCGLALGVALIVDAITDPLAGSLSDNWSGRLGRRHPFMYASALPLALCFFGLFSPPAGLGTSGLFAWLLGFAILTRLAMTLYHVPHLALGAELTQNFEERTSIVAYRQAFSYVGNLAAVVIGFGWFFADARGGRLNAEAYAPYAVVLAALMTLTIWISAYGTQKEIPHLPRASRDPDRNVLRRMLREARTAFRNASFRWLFSGVLVVFLMVGVDLALNLYMYQYFWELPGSQILILGIATPIGLFVGTLFTQRLHRYFDKRTCLVVGTGGWAVCQITPVVLRLLDAFPENGTSALIWTLIGFRLAQGAIVQQAQVSFGSMMADVADEHELESGRRQEGIFFGAVAFSGKASTGLGNIVAGVGLDVIRWPRGAAIQSAADVPPETLVELGLLYGPIVSSFAVLSVWCYGHYRLTRERHERILSELAVRRAAAEPLESEAGGAQAIPGRLSPLAGRLRS
jgi:Na+/melibiose symporter-like transporter